MWDHGRIIYCNAPNSTKNMFKYFIFDINPHKAESKFIYYFRTKFKDVVPLKNLHFELWMDVLYIIKLYILFIIY
jgi:hypothetical protein